MTTKEEQKYYDVDQVIDVIRMLSKSQGYYGRLLENIMYLYENEPYDFDVFARTVEEQKFTNPLDVVLFFEQ